MKGIRKLRAKRWLLLVVLLIPLLGWLSFRFQNLIQEQAVEPTSGKETVGPRDTKQLSPTKRVSQAKRNRESLETMMVSPLVRSQLPLSREIEVAETTGDFRPLKNSYGELSQGDKMAHFPRIAATYSKLGPKHDIEMKRSILETLSAPASTLARFERAILELEARERYDRLKEDGVIQELSANEFSHVCEAIANSRISKGFSIIADASDEETQRQAARSVARFAVRADLMEASRVIGALPSGIIREEAIAEMVVWLRNTGSGEEAQPWLDEIKDETIKNRLIKR
jgi:hypothetical protein